MKRLFILIIILAACQPAPEPTPLPSEETIYTSHLPIVTGFGNCTVSDKAGLAWANIELGWPKGLLCFGADSFYHNWGAVGGTTPDGLKISMVWCIKRNGYDYPQRWIDDFLRPIEAILQRPYDGFVLWGNEPDRPDQCGRSILEMAQLFLRLARECPNCKLIGPGYSSADDGQKVKQVWDKVNELCGSPCPELNARYANNPHHFPIPLGWNIDTRLDIFCQTVYGGDCEHPNWPTVGWRDCYPNVRTVFSEWIRQLERRPDVERYFFYTTKHTREGSGCDFDWAADYVDGRWFIRDLGEAFRAGQ